MGTHQNAPLCSPGYLWLSNIHHPLTGTSSFTLLNLPAPLLGRVCLCCRVRAGAIGGFAAGYADLVCGASPWTGRLADIPVAVRVACSPVSPNDLRRRLFAGEPRPSSPHTASWTDLSTPFPGELRGAPGFWQAMVDPPLHLKSPRLFLSRVTFQRISGGRQGTPSTENAQCLASGN